MEDVVAEKDLVGIYPTGEKMIIKIRIGRPYPVEEGNWACPVAIPGLYDKLRDIRGVDSFQALVLALSLARSLLEAFVEDGGRLLWPNTEEEAVLSELFWKVRA